MSTDPRAVTISRLLAAMWGRSEPSKYDQQNATVVLDALSEADQAAGIYRVSLDAAIEAAAKARYEAETHALPWEETAFQDYHRNKVRACVTAAVMGGAQ